MAPRAPLLALVLGFATATCPATGTISLDGKPLRNACPPGSCERRCAELCANETARARVALDLHHARPLPLQSFGGCYPLRPEAFARSLRGESGAARLAAFRAKLERGAAVTVVVVGGSVAAGFAAGGSASSTAFARAPRGTPKTATTEMVSPNESAGRPRMTSPNESAGRPRMTSPNESAGRPRRRSGSGGATRRRA